MGVFDGLASRLSRRLGGVIPAITSDGVRIDIQAIYRRDPFEVPNGKGTTTRTVIPTLSFDNRLLATLGGAFKIKAPNGEWYQCVGAPEESGSPAVDAEVTVELARCDAPE